MLKRNRQVTRRAWGLYMITVPAAWWFDFAPALSHGARAKPDQERETESWQVRAAAGQRDGGLSAPVKG